VPSYLSSGELAAFGIAGATDAQLAAASRLVDGYLGRPEGVTWVAGGDGAPAYMENLTPRLTLQGGQAFAAGANVVVPVANAMLAQVGDVVVVDRATPGICEPLVVAAVSAQALTFSNVVFNHAQGAALDLGMVISEETEPTRDGAAELLRRPIARALSASYLDATVSPVLTDIQPSGALYVHLPTLYPFSTTLGRRGLTDALASTPRMPTTTVHYLAGFPSGGAPDRVKRAVANIVLAMRATPQLGANVKSFAAGQTKVERFHDSMIDSTAAAALADLKVLSFA
jgi:hypothetical protein